MPSVTVKLLYTPRPEGNETTVRVGGGDYYPIKFDSEYGSGEVLAAVPLNTTAAEAIAVAQALTIVAGCADDRWRGWHWEAREANGQLLATCPPGEWYGDKRDAVQAIRALFGVRSIVLLDDSPSAETLRLPTTGVGDGIYRVPHSTRRRGTAWATLCEGCGKELYLGPGSKAGMLRLVAACGRKCDACRPSTIKSELTVHGEDDSDATTPGGAE